MSLSVHIEYCGAFFVWFDSIYVHFKGVCTPVFRGWVRVGAGKRCNGWPTAGQLALLTIIFLGSLCCTDTHPPTLTYTQSLISAAFFYTHIHTSLFSIEFTSNGSVCVCELTFGCCVPSCPV